jgi:putative ABC transport system permease protein
VNDEQSGGASGEGISNTLEYKSESLLEQAKKLQDLSKSTNQMLIWIAGISLLVGGIGVMNIMLVSVTERTREIGTRKALGAKNSSIRAQFLVEAIIICLIGGAIGLVLGVAGGMALTNYMGYPAKPSIGGILLSIGFSVSIGLIFGYVPANKAAKMNPIDALRYE